MTDKGFLFGLRQSLYIGVGYAPVAITYGILALKCGLNIWEAGFMSLFVFAGASQFIAIQLISQGATLWVIGLTTLIVNIRHILMSFSMIRFFPGLSLGKLAVLAHGVTDESFVLNSKLLEGIDTLEQRSQVTLGVNMGAYMFWVGFSFLGAWLGNRIGVNFSGFDFALIALFIVLTVATVNLKNLPVYLLAGALAVIFKLLLPGKTYLLLSVALAAAIGAWFKHHQDKKGIAYGEEN